jgi:hypothetical protein
MGGRIHLFDAGDFIRQHVAASESSTELVHLSGGWEDVDGTEPCLDKGRPMGDGKRSWSEAVAVAALRVDVEFGGDFELLERLCVEEDSACLRRAGRWVW